MTKAVTSLTPEQLAPFQGKFARNNVEQLRNDLLSVAISHAIGSRSQQFKSGICYAVFWAVNRRCDTPEHPSWYDAYTLVSRIIRLAHDAQFGVFLYPDNPNDHWEQRATMCLLMAEWITTEILEA